MPEGGWIATVACAITTAVNANGRREALGLDVPASQDAAGWTAFLSSLVARGLSGVELVISDAHEGLVRPHGAIGAVLVGARGNEAAPIPCQHPGQVPQGHPAVRGHMVGSIFPQPDARQVALQLERVIGQLADAPLSRPSSCSPEGAGPDITALASLPVEQRRQIWSNDSQGRLNREVRRRIGVARIFPNRAATVRLVGAVLVERHDERALARRSISLESLAKASVPPRLRGMTRRR